MQVPFHILPPAKGQQFGAQTAYGAVKASSRRQCRNADFSRSGAVILEPGPHKARPERACAETLAASHSFVPDRLPKDESCRGRAEELVETVRGGNSDLPEHTIKSAASAEQGRRGEETNFAEPRARADEPGRRYVRRARAAGDEG